MARGMRTTPRDASAFEHSPGRGPMARVRRWVCAGAGIMALLGGHDARAASYTWAGSGTTSLWSTPLNWSAGVLPATGTNSVVFRGSTRLSNFVNGTYTVDRLEFASDAAPFTVSGTGLGRSIVMRGAIVNSSSNRQTIGGTLFLRYGTNTATRVIDTGTSGGSIVINANLVDSSEGQGEFPCARTSFPLRKRQSQRPVMTGPATRDLSD